MKTSLLLHHTYSALNVRAGFDKSSLGETQNAGKSRIIQLFSFLITFFDDVNFDPSRIGPKNFFCIHLFCLRKTQFIWDIT